MKKFFLFSLSLLSLFLFSCQDENKSARIEVWLTDAPGDYEQVNIDLQGVEINTSEAENGWQSLEITPETYNLLDLANGNETFLGDLDIPGGRISQIRLKLGDNNSVKLEGEDEGHKLVVPSGEVSGLKIQVHKVLEEGVTYKVLLDFEAGKSVVKTGPGAFLLKPVIRAITEAQNGAIKGSVTPKGIVAISVLDDEGVEVSTTATDEEGAFQVLGLAAGTYTLVFDSGEETPDVEKADVSVVAGETTDIGIVSME